MLISSDPFPLERCARWANALIMLGIALALECGIAASGRACGLDVSLPPTPFVGFDDYRFAHWEEWGKIKPDPKSELELPIHVGWTPIPDVQTSPILGEGWILSLFESTFVPASPTHFVWRTPFGHTWHLEQDRKNPNMFSGAGWLVEVRGTGLHQVATFQSSCGRWQLTYNSGRLAQMKSRETTLDFTYSKDGTRQLLSRGKVVASLKREFDKTTTLPYWRLSFLSGDGQRNAILTLGTRLVLIRRDAKSGQKRNAATLVSMKFDDQPERRFDFKQDALNVRGGNVKPAQGAFRWDVANSLLKEDNDYQYSFVFIQGIKCFKQTARNGKTYIRGENRDKGITIEKLFDSEETIQTNVFPANSSLSGKLRSRHRIENSGKITLLEQCIYDENKQMIRHINSDQQITYSAKNETAKNLKTGAILWSKKFGNDGKISEFVNDSRVYSFRHLGEKTEVTITDKKQNTTSTVSLQSSDIQNIFP